MKLAVFPTDPIRAYVEKGEVVPNYYNPKDTFDEIMVVSPALDDSLEGAMTMFGKANVDILHMKHPNLLNYRKRELYIKDFSPDVVRAYDPLLNGYRAMNWAKLYKVPLVLSVHANYKQEEAMAGFVRSLKQEYLNAFVVPKVVRSADVVISAYKFVQGWVDSFRPKRSVVIYNRVGFKPLPKEEHRKFTVISVGRLDRERRHDRLIESLDGCHLIIVGRGPEERRLRKLARGKDVEFVQSVPNSEMPKLYARADAYATAMKYGGISKPMLEAAACGLPIFADPLKVGPDMERLIHPFADDPEELEADVYREVLKS